MQFIVISHQLWEFLWSVLLGLAFGFLYDLLRFLRRFFKPVNIEIIIANFLDFLYLVFCGIAYSIFLYAASNGRFRWFTLFGIFCGFVLYSTLPSKIVRPFLFFIADKLYLFLLLLICPIKKLLCLIFSTIHTLYLKIRRQSYLLKTSSMKKMLQSEVKLN